MKFFLYGIFLSPDQRSIYDMDESTVEYATVPNYVTQHIGGGIVQAVRVASKYEIHLTGIVCDVPEKSVRYLDMLERGYDRITTQTLGGDEVQMYVSPERTDRDG